jgi:hypothetical protein
MAELHTQQFMGRGQLVNRLTAQVGSRSFANALLVKRGDMTNQGQLTVAGEVSNAKTAEERAQGRAAERTGKPESSFDYDPTTNSTSLT